MRRLLSILAGTCLGVSTMLAQTPASGKTTSAWKCGVPSPAHAIPVGDSANHMYVVQQVKCTATKGEIGGVKEQDGTATEFADIVGDKVTGHGIFVETLANGDKVNVTYTFQGTSKDKAFQMGSNKWTFVSGTGMMKGAKGSGTCKAKGNADGTTDFECTGTHTLAK